jgi:hypothetical protein
MVENEDDPPQFAKPRKALEDMSPEERIHSDAIDLRCLTLCIAMLERVNSVRYQLSHGRS